MTTLHKAAGEHRSSSGRAGEAAGHSLENWAGASEAALSNPTTFLGGLRPMNADLKWLAAGAILWIAYQIAYLTWDLRIGPANDETAALHLPNFLMVAGTFSLLSSRWRFRHWRPILFAAAIGLAGWTVALCLLRGTPLPLLTTLMLLVLIPGALAPWRWYWTGACTISALAALVVLQLFMPGIGAWFAYWDDYWPLFLLAIALSYAAAVARELRQTRRSYDRLRIAERRLVTARTDLRGRINSLQASEKRLREEIEERKRAEERAREQESVLRAIFEASPDPIGISSMPEGKIIDINRCYGELMGLSREEAKGRRTIDTGVIAEKCQFDEYAKRLMREGVVSNCEMDLRAPDGTVGPFLVSAVLTEIRGEQCAVAIGRDISGVRKAEDMLRTIAQSVPDAVALTSYPEGRVVYCNRGYELLLGAPKEAIIGRLVAEIGVWARAEDERRYARLIRRQGSVRNVEMELRAGDGTIGSWLMSGLKLEIQGKECILTTCRDISAMKRTERDLMAAREELKAQVEALRASEERLRQEASGREEVEKRLRRSEAMFRKVFDTSIDIIGINRIADGRYVALNRTLLEFSGLSEKEIIGRSALELGMWEDRERSREYLRLLRRDGSVHGFEANLRRWDGTLVPFVASAIVVDIDDEPCIVAIAHDISARKGAEMSVMAAREELSRQLEATRESEHRAQESEAILRKIFDANTNSTSLIRIADGKHLAVNQASANIFGYSLQEMNQRSNQDLDFWVNKEDWREYLRRLRNEGHIRNMEVQLRAKDGHVLIGQLSAEVAEVGGERCVVAITADITDRKRIEAELVAAREEAVAASEAKSQFLSSMSHEIRTPLNAMLGMADLLWETALTAEQRRFLDTIRSNSNALLNLINGILDLAKVESGRLSLEWISFDPRELAERVVETLGVKAHQKRLELGARIAPAVPAELLGDPLRLRQILMNLIGNAIKFTEHGEVVLEIEPCAEEPSPASRASGGNGSGNGNMLARQKLHFIVRDTGIGIEPDRIDRIFSTFTQADSSTERKYGGSGLGLAIVKRLVEVMGGSLSVTSKPGEGSVFSLVIPFQLPTGASLGLNIATPWVRPGLAERPKPPAKAILPQLDGRRVLVADDTAINRTILREVLEPRGARVEEAPNGQAALRMVTQALESGDPYGLVLVDGRMPGLDGIETARRLLRDDEMSFRCGAVILMVTSDALNPTLARCRQLGIQLMATFRYVVKPVRMADLAEAIEQVLCMGAAATPGANAADGLAPAMPPLASANRSNKGKVAAPVTNGNTRPLRVLLAEDSPDNRMLIEAYFKGTNYQLETVENGELAVERFTQSTFDAVLMDIHMPVMDGYTATRKIREWEQDNGRERTPVMALTAAAQEEAVRESLAAGCDSHLAKPIRRSVLLQAIEEMASRKNAANAIGSAKCAVPGTNGESKLRHNVVQIDADLSDLVPGFMAHKREDARTIAAAIELGDYETLSQVGHKMKGEGGSYGFDAITTMGAALEDAAKVKDQAAARHWAHELVAFLDTVEIVYA